MDCAYVHRRNIGTHISKLKMPYLDLWTENEINILQTTGNQISNDIYESNINGTIKITKESSYDEKKKFIMEKYDQKKFIN